MKIIRYLLVFICTLLFTLQAFAQDDTDPAATASPMNQALYMHYITSIQLGLLFGNITNSRSGYINTPLENFSGSHSQNNFNFGPQLRLMFGSPAYLHTFIMLNALTMFNATNTLLRLRTDPSSSYNSVLRLQTLWVAHFIIGLQTAFLLNNLNLSAGVGGALIRQRLRTTIAEDVTTNVTNNQTHLAPSWMLSLDYKLCKTCLWGHDLSLSGQLSADKYPAISSTVTTPLGNINQSKALGGDWLFSEALVLSMNF